NPPLMSNCPPPPANSVSVFRPNGTPLSGDKGFTAGPLNYPQGTMSAPEGDIWIAQRAPDAGTVYPKRPPSKAFEMPIPSPEGSSAVMKPFGMAIDHEGNAWMTGSLNSTLAVIGPDGKVIEVIPSQDPNGRTQLSRPMGNASDSHGNIWVANSDF